MPQILRPGVKGDALHTAYVLPTARGFKGDLSSIEKNWQNIMCFSASQMQMYIFAPFLDESEAKSEDKSVGSQ